MARRLMWVGVLLAVAATGGVFYYRAATRVTQPSVVTVPVTRGDVVETVEATGTLQAVTTVQVGTQVSGTIKALHADFNSRVRRGQVIAELEPSLFDAQVEQARASLLRLEAEAQRAVVQQDDAQRKLTRAATLASQQLIASVDLETAEMNVRVADAAVGSANAQVVQARASLHQADVNLAHTIITAPIDGIVISRNVDVGQTVAASMQAPTLFVLARDLSAMQVNANIAESDIGRIRTGQSAAFRVDAYPADAFSGTVSQVRLQPVVEQNVVSYVTVIEVPNPELKLKPGMTANVTVEIARASDTLRVPNVALRVRPSADVLAVLAHASDGNDDGYPGVWAQVDGLLTRVPVRVGITDGTRTAIASDRLAEGDAIVTSIVTGEPPAQVAGTSPLLPQARGRTGGAGRGPAGTPPPAP